METPNLEAKLKQVSKLYFSNDPEVPVFLRENQELVDFLLIAYDKLKECFGDVMNMASLSIEYFGQNSLNVAIHTQSNHETYVACSDKFDQWWIQYPPEYLEKVLFVSSPVSVEKQFGLPKELIFQYRGK